jgi:ABC-2 type transport system ATP-binding protein/lipopolysaccharide transport system ATP-binding protein
LLTASRPILIVDAPITGEPLVGLEGVSVRYRVPRERINSFKEYAIRRVQGMRIQHDEFWALREVSLTVYRGEIYGIVGRNGAGKSTLLKVVARVLRPTTGRVWVKGQVAPLLDLGAGFHPELTGRENVFLNGTLLGRSRDEIAARLEDIAEFSELGDFMDAPLRTYSSGMAARLGFAVATAWKPEILILDEILAVGDQAFQRKCLGRMQAFVDEGTTILVTMHSGEMIRQICGRALWLDQGHVVALGSADEVVEAYKAALDATAPWSNPAQQT